MNSFLVLAFVLFFPYRIIASSALLLTPVVVTSALRCTILK